MRQVKFRAWDKQVNEFVPDIYIRSDGWHFQQSIDDHNPNIVIEFFTGLSDKNGKDVYEGDKTEDGIIEFNVDTCCYIIRRPNKTFIRLNIRKDNIEIIGNIHQTNS